MASSGIQSIQSFRYFGDSVAARIDGAPSTREFFNFINKANLSSLSVILSENLDSCFNFQPTYCNDQQRFQILRNFCTLAKCCAGYNNFFLVLLRLKLIEMDIIYIRMRMCVHTSDITQSPIGYKTLVCHRGYCGVQADMAKHDVHILNSIKANVNQTT